MAAALRQSFVSESTQYTAVTGHVTRCVEALFINLKGYGACVPELIHS